MKEDVFLVNGVSIFGIREGVGSPILCMHGITGNGYVFEPIVRHLASKHCVISIDQRGHGRSSVGDSYGAVDYARDALEITRQLNLGPSILMGHSLGARNALVAATMEPELVRGVIALDFTPFIEEQVLMDLEGRVTGGNRVFESIESIEAYLKDRYPMMPIDAVKRRAVHGYREAKEGYRPLADARAMALTSAGLKEDLAPVVREIDVPTILVRGAVSKLVSQQAWALTRQLRPDLRAVEVERADHYIPEVRPDAVVRLAQEFAGSLN